MPPIAFFKNYGHACESKHHFSLRHAMGTEIFHTPKKSITRQRLSTAVRGNEGGFAPNLARCTEDWL